MKRALLTKEDLENRIDIARGIKSAELVLKNAQYLDVFTGQWCQGDIAIYKNTIVGLGESYNGEREILLNSKFLVPGFIDSHVHIESSCIVPLEYEKTVLPRGTTGAIVDPHEIANVLGSEGINYFLKCSEISLMDFYIMLSSCVPATTHLETSGARLDVEALKQFKNHSHILGLAEMMNYPGVLFKDGSVLNKILEFQNLPIDGHCPQLRGKDLNAYLSTGIMSCHESIDLQEAKEKLSKGMQVLLREGSVAKNLKDLCPLLTDYSSPKISFCSDDRNPLDILEEGHMDHLIRLSIKNGVTPEVAYRSASWSTAQAYGLKTKGAIAPGFDADLVVLDDIHLVKVNSVFKKGLWIKQTEDIPTISVKAPRKNSIQCKVPDLKEFEYRFSSGEFRVIEVVPHQIITRERREQFIDCSNIIEPDFDRDILKIVVLERHGHNKPLSKGLVKGFGLKQGALGSSVCHDSHNLVVVGTSDRDMRACIQWLIKNGGGFVAINNEEIVSELALPVAGLMCELPSQEVYLKLKQLRVAASKFGCQLQEPFLQLAFLCLPVIPEIKITDLGLVDVNQFSLVGLKI